MRSTSRIADCSINTVTKLLEEIGTKCADYQDEHLIRLTCRRIQIDELWSFVYAKGRNAQDVEEAGDIWTFTAIDPDTKLIPCWLVGARSSKSAKIFLKDLSDRMIHRIELTSDGFNKYRAAVDKAFDLGIDYAMLIKNYAPMKGGRYGEFNGLEKVKLRGSPNMEKLTTSHVERLNLTLRTSMKRFTRRTNAHSKKLDNHIHAMAITTMHYNFARIHSSLRVSPAMAAGVTDRLWSIEDIASL